MSHLSVLKVYTFKAQILLNNIADSTPPFLLSCPTSMTVLQTELWGKEVTFPTPTATDAIDNNLTVTTSPPDLKSPYNFTEDTTCTYTFVDDSANEVVCLFDIYLRGTCLHLSYNIYIVFVLLWLYGNLVIIFHHTRLSALNTLKGRTPNESDVNVERNVIMKKTPVMIKFLRYFLQPIQSHEVTLFSSNLNVYKSR